MNSDTMVVLCRKCRQKIALPMGFDSPVFLCPRCQTSMQTPPEIMAPSPAIVAKPVAAPQSKPQPVSAAEIHKQPPVSVKQSVAAPSQPVASPVESPFASELPDQSQFDVTAPSPIPDLKDVPPVTENAAPVPKVQNPTTTQNYAADTALSVMAEIEIPAAPAQSADDKSSSKSAAGGKKSYASAYAAKGGRAGEKPSAPSKTMAASTKKPAVRNIRRELVEKVGESALVAMIKEFAENEVASQPIPKPEFLQKLMKKGLSANDATDLISYAQNSPEGKEIALGTSWQTFYWGVGAMVGGVLLNILTVAATGYIVKYFMLIPLLGFIAVVNSGQKILTVSFPMFSKTSVQAMIFLAFLLIGGIFFYFTVLS
ncbi:MAG: hypothetical protein ACD_39C01117G0003 [uncultured bacterium]|nr:MAG: hypothetical protein ACD_39C01117G0003 [uncultured bacterium]